MDASTFATLTEAGLGASSSRGVLQPAAMSLDADSTPIVYHATDILTPNNHESQPVGKNEAHMACITLLRHIPQAESIDVTDGIGFPWQRFLRSQSHAREIIGPGVLQVCVVPRENGPSLAFVRTDGNTYIVTPCDMKSVPPYIVTDATEVPRHPICTASSSWARAA